MRRAVAALLLALPFAGVPFVADWVAERQAARVGEGLAVLAEALNADEARKREADSDEVVLWRSQFDQSTFDELTLGQIESLGERGAHRSRLAPKQGLFVSAEKVLALVRAGARPSGLKVAPQGQRPGGLMLMGVSGLGIGLQDGDILTHALGQPAVSEASLVGAVIRARGARIAHLSGQVWRNGTAFPLVVAQPYLDAG
jgi:hypothetical protein